MSPVVFPSPHSAPEPDAASDTELRAAIASLKSTYGTLGTDTDAVPVVKTTVGQVRVLTPESSGGQRARTRPYIRNRAKLARAATAFATKAAPMVTCIGNSITWGVGSDGSGGTTAGVCEPYRQYAWPVQLRKALARMQNFLPSDDFIHPGFWYGITTNRLGSASYQEQACAFPTGAAGGLNLPDATASFDFDATKMGKFTQVDVYHFGSAFTGSAYSPRILVDGVQKSAGGVLSALSINVVSITGLSDATHTITVQGTASGGSLIPGVIIRRSATGTIVNRVALPGTKASDVLGGAAYVATQKSRVIDAALLYGYSDLVILSMTANEVLQQQPLATYQDAVQQLITRAVAGGACVLLLADPPVINGEGYAIKESQYRAVLAALSDANDHVAYASFADLFGDAAAATAMGLSNGTSLHPMLEGHRRMADWLLQEALPHPAV